MAHKSKLSLAQQVFNMLESKARYGHSKHEDKKAGVSEQYIYSFDTMKTYKKQSLAFVRWVKEHVASEIGRQPRTLAECRPYVERYLQERQAAGMSASTLHTDRAALGKLYGERIDVALPAARRAEITRSRGDAVRDAHFSVARNSDLVNFCLCAGPRRSEYELLKPSALEYHDGVPYVHYTDGTKGGRERLSPITGTPEEVARAIDHLMHLTGNNHASDAFDMHDYRSRYAMRVYEAHKGDLDALKGKRIDYTALTGKTTATGDRIYKSALYVCRSDLCGVAYDRAAMIQASRALGHNRESVVAGHYFR